MQDLFDNSPTAAYIKANEQGFQEQINSKEIDFQETDQMPTYMTMMIDKLKDMEENCWLKGIGYKSPHFPQMADATGGWEDGLYLVAGAPNTGKSAEMMNIIYDLVSVESNDMFSLYFSLDDSLMETIPRVIAMTEKIAIDVVRKPVKYEDQAELLTKRTAGWNKLYKTSKNMAFFDNGECPFIEDIEQKVKEYKMALTEANRPNAKFLIVIDAFDDLDSRDDKFKEENAKSAFISKWAKDLSKSYDCLVFCTKHLRKLNGYRRPAVDDLKDSGTIVYEANCVMLCYNEVGLKEEKADVYYERQGSPSKQPIIEVHFAKNKLSSFKGRIFTKFIPDFSNIEECSVEEGRHYNTLVFQA